MAFLVGGANSAVDTEPYDIDNSLRFNDGDSPFLSFTPASAGNRRTWTFSCWIKLGTLGINRIIFAGGVVASTYLRIFDTDVVGFGVSGDANYAVGPILRDPSAWYHLVYKVDTTAGSNRMIIFVNGETVYSGTPSSWDLNHDGHVNQDELHSVGKETDGTSADRFFDGYMAEVFFIDGTAHDASDFGETDSDSGIWKPKDCKDDLTFGTNGFYLEFKQTGTSADSSGKGADTSGEDNHYDDNGMTAEDQCTDTPTNNFATLNPLMNSSQASYSEGNLDEACNDNYGVGGSIAVANGKWYWEVKIKAGDNNLVGIANGDEVWRFPVTFAMGNYSLVVYGVNGVIYREGSVVEDVDDPYGANDIVGVAVDMDSGTRTVQFYKNGSAFGSAATLPTNWGFTLPMIRKGGSSQTSSFNFGNPAFSISSGNADANGYGNFEYEVPSGFYALCTKNLAEYG
jgi:hypothetical protein